jgi:hypothetical protein
LSCAATETAIDVDASIAYIERLVPLGRLPFSYVRPSAPEPFGRRVGFGLNEDVTICFLAQSLFRIQPNIFMSLQLILGGDPKGVILLLKIHDDA